MEALALTNSRTSSIERALLQEVAWWELREIEARNYTQDGDEERAVELRGLVITH